VPKNRSIPNLRAPLAPVLSAAPSISPREHSVAFVSGNFNVVHPGHLRLLRFAAEQADRLVVGINPDNAPGVSLPQEVRVENVRALHFVDETVALRDTAAAFIREFKPDVVVKGKEYEGRTNAEQADVASYGGRLIFSAGEMRFTSLSLLERDYHNSPSSVFRKPTSFADHHGFEIGELKILLAQMAGMRVLVIGDLIVDDYITCDPLGMSQEDPTLVVAPILTKTFVGGAGGVAAQARGLGADVHYVSVVGDDEPAQFALSELTSQGIACTFSTDASRPTTRKQRYRALNKTLLRVNHLRHHPASHEIQDQLIGAVDQALARSDLILFSCFNYGCLPQRLVDAITDKASNAKVMLAADSQASSQLGDVSRFRHMSLITPTEREARLALSDFETGLSAISERLLAKSCAANLIITLGAEGSLINTAPEGTLQTDRLPAFNSAPRDVAGAGDSLFTSTAMALRTGASIWQSAYLGSLAAALQVAKVGNGPLARADILAQLDDALVETD
jgi:rfaE bifunctional protein kinase chain/domain